MKHYRGRVTQVIPVGTEISTRSGSPYVTWADDDTAATYHGDFWAALREQLRPVADGWYVHEDDLDDLTRHFGLSELPRAATGPAPALYFTDPDNPYADPESEAVMEEHAATYHGDTAKPCRAAANIKGEHVPCDWPTDENGKHDGWAHANSEHEIIWQGADE